MLITGADTRVIELRIQPGPRVGDADLLGALAAVDVAGDGVTRVVQPADRLRRPAPGPVLTSGGRPVARTVEGYLWDALVPGVAARAGWALLAPSALVNAAHWMLPPIRSGVTDGVGATLRALVRVAGVLLTGLVMALLTTTAAALTADVGDVARTAATVVPPMVALLAVHAIAVRGARSAAASTGATSGTPGLASAHTAAGLAAVVAVGVGGPVGTAPVGPLTVAAVALLTAGAAAGAALRRPDGPRTPVDVVAGVAAGLAVAMTLAVAVVGALRPEQVPGPATQVPVVLAAVLGAVVLTIAVLLVPASRAGAGAARVAPPGQRPWLAGLAAAPVLTLGCVAAAAAATVPGLILVPADTPLEPVLGFGAAVLACVVTVAAGALPTAATTRPVDVPDATLLHRGPLPTRVGRAWRRAARARTVVPVLLAVTSVAAVAGVVCAILLLGDDRAASAVELGRPLGVIVAALLLGGAAVVAHACADPVPGPAATLLGIVGSLPRRAHPFTAPSPGPRVIDEVAARAAVHLAGPDTRVVLAGTGHAALIALLAADRLLAGLGPTTRERVGVVTAGTAVQWAHQRAFPTTLGHHTLARWAATLDERWRALCRGTDAAGGPVTTWGHQRYGDDLLGAGYRGGRADGALRPARHGEHGALVLGGDHWLPDPQRGPVAGRRWRPGVACGDDYSADPEWDCAVAVAAGLPPGRGPALPRPVRGRHERSSATAASTRPAPASRPAGAST